MPLSAMPPASPASAPPAVPDFDGRLSVVVAVRDEADNIGPLIDEIHAALQAGAAKVPAFELIYVDDGSTDATPQRLAEARRRFARLRVLRHRRSCGQSTALATGVRAAHYPWIATLDGDRQNDPADIPALVARLAPGRRPPRLALIAGWRTQRHDSAVRKISSRIANAVRAALLGDRTPDTGCGLKVFPREVFLRLPFFDHMHRFMPALFLREGLEVASVPVRHRPRVAGRSKYGIGNRLWVGLVDLMGVLWLQRRMKHPETLT
jgi:dolichol-phosphate mannosyltransferase